MVSLQNKLPSLIGLKKQIKKQKRITFWKKPSIQLIHEIILGYFISRVFRLKDVYTLSKLIKIDIELYGEEIDSKQRNGMLSTLHVELCQIDPQQFSRPRPSHMFERSHGHLGQFQVRLHEFFRGKQRFIQFNHRSRDQRGGHGFRQCRGQTGLVGRGLLVRHQPTEKSQSFQLRKSHITSITLETFQVQSHA